MNMNKILKQAQKMQQDLQKAQAEVEALEITATSGGGAVEVVIKGNYQLKSLRIDSDIAKDDVEMLQDMIVAAVNNAVEQLKAASEQKMGSLAGGMPGIPGLF